MSRIQLAPAKVNLYLHVGAVDARGYHPLQSLVAFADIGDEVELLDENSEGSGDLLTIYGPFSQGLSSGEDNLVIKAVRRFETIADVRVRRRLHLRKNLPIASGLGGGSSDAGAALRLLRAAYAPDMADDVLADIAGQIGADGIMCLWIKPSIAEGYGEKLTPVDMPALPCVLINPGVECATAAVYEGFDAAGGEDLPNIASRPGVLDIAGMVNFLRTTRNDLQAPAIRLQPVISDVLESLSAQPETLLARMSGSGATCFALCATDADAEALGRRMQTMWPAAWVCACRLG